jgi:hypothetical protein
VRGSRSIAAYTILPLLHTISNESLGTLATLPFKLLVYVVATTVFVVGGTGTQDASEITTMVAITSRPASLHLDSFNFHSVPPADWHR